MSTPEAAFRAEHAKLSNAPVGQAAAGPVDPFVTSGYTARMLMKLQRQAGNAAVKRLLDRYAARQSPDAGAPRHAEALPEQATHVMAAGAGAQPGPAEQTGTGAGLQRLAHELSNVVQQRAPIDEHARMAAALHRDPSSDGMGGTGTQGSLQRTFSRSSLAQRAPKRGATLPKPESTDPPEQQLGNIQGHAMDALLPELRDLAVKIRTDEALGQRIGGPRLVMAMQAVKAKTQGATWPTFLDAKKDDFQAWPPDQVVSVLKFLGATEQGASKQLVSVSLHDIVSNAQGDLPLTAKARELLIGNTVADLVAASASYALVSQLVRDVRQRVLVSLYMQSTQKGTNTKKGLAKGFSYPNRKGDGTLGVQARVNEEALGYWGPVQSPGGNYFFNLSPAGKANAYQAIVSLFKEQTDPHLRTLIHCDYLVSVIEYRAWAETIGIAKFNENVKLGNITPVLKWNGFTDLARSIALSEMPTSATVTTDTPLKIITVGSESDLIIGDHVVFFNDPTYSALTEGDPDVWKLENAIVVDRGGSGHLYQGHGYSSPVPTSVLMDAMCNKYNLHVSKALSLINAEKTAKTTTQRIAAEQERKKLYPNVRAKGAGGQWEVSGASDITGGTATRDLKPISPSTAPGLHHPSDGAIRARRPDHTVP